jgi:hypothetical protein
LVIGGCESCEESREVVTGPYVHVVRQRSEKYSCVVGACVYVDGSHHAWYLALSVAELDDL